MIQVEVKPSKIENESSLTMIGANIDKPTTLPLKSDCLLNITSPFYRGNNSRLKVKEDNELEFPGQLQVSYANKTFLCDQGHTKYINDKKYAKRNAEASSERH